MEKHLLDETKEAKQAREKIRSLLISNDKENQLLALNLLEGGGVHESLWTGLIMTCELSSHEEVVLKIHNLYNVYDLMWTWEAGCTISMNLDKETWLYFLEGNKQGKVFFEKFKGKINKKEMALFALFLRKIGLNYCLKEKLLNPKIALELFIEGDTLNLESTFLEVLPKEVGCFTKIKNLHLGYNECKNIPDEIKNLKSLEKLTYYNNHLTDEAIHKLESFFPKIYAQKYNKEANDAYNNKNYKESKRLNDKALTLDSTTSIIITKSSIISAYEKNYIKSITILEELAKTTNPEMEGELLILIYANLSNNYYKIKAYEKGLMTANKGFEVLYNYPKTQKKWEAKLYFHKGQNLFYLNKLQDLLNVYQEGLKKYPNNYKILYNIACIYPCWNNKKETLAYLEKAINFEQSVKKLARKDTDFKKYWEDKDFIVLTKD